MGEAGLNSLWKFPLGTGNECVLDVTAQGRSIGELRFCKSFFCLEESQELRD